MRMLSTDSFANKCSRYTHKYVEIGTYEGEVISYVTFSLTFGTHKYEE